MKSKIKAWSGVADDRDTPPPAWTSENTDVEKITAAPLQRRLQPRHLQMIAIGGTVGTGLVCEILTTGHLTNMQYAISIHRGRTKCIAND
jgi:amino acid permease